MEEKLKELEKKLEDTENRLRELEEIIYGYQLENFIYQRPVFVG